MKTREGLTELKQASITQMDVQQVMERDVGEISAAFCSAAWSPLPSSWDSLWQVTLRHDGKRPRQPGTRVASMEVFGFAQRYPNSLSAPSHFSPQSPKCSAGYLHEAVGDISTSIAFCRLFHWPETPVSFLI